MAMMQIYDIKKRKYLKTNRYLRGDIWMAELPELNEDGVQQGYRPVIILQNDIGNKYSPSVIIASITSSNEKVKKNFPTHFNLDSIQKNVDLGMEYIESTVLLEQITTINKSRLEMCIGHLNDEEMRELEVPLLKSLGVIPVWND